MSYENDTKKIDEIVQSRKIRNKTQFILEWFIPVFQSMFWLEKKVSIKSIY